MTTEDSAAQASRPRLRPFSVKVLPERFAEGLARIPQRGADWARTAAIAGDADAQILWGQMLLAGHGVDRDPAAALRWFRIAARSGSPDAANLLGRCHELGWGTDIDLQSAAHWYRIAARQGHAWAQFNLARLMLRDDPAGGGIAGSMGEALALLVRSARQGNAKAMNMIGRAREEGWTGRPNVPSAQRWYERAARGGCFRGQFHTARFLLADGRIAEAVDWLHKSIAAAPAEFCRDLSRLLQEHGDERVRSVAALALERVAQPAPQPGDSASPVPLPPASGRSAALRRPPHLSRRIRGLVNHWVWRLKAAVMPDKAPYA